MLLVKHGLLGSATALMRPSFEAFVRGLWLQWPMIRSWRGFRRAMTLQPQRR
ncbi:DUF6988 family protein [Stenotrophomonas maltophilia]|uniref:DUF6988 family protein n=1 Tax=Stenotrophomonas maltophilia TaxID=40324 RepID=UPI003D18E05E